MLLDFKFKNFKTFREETLFSMTPAQKIKDLEYSVLKAKIGKKVHKGLSAAVIYGPNASGKTNIISALEVFKSIVLKGNIKNGDFVFASVNEAIRRLELIPNLSLNAPEPVEFEIKFIEDDILYQYGIKFELGMFLDGEYDRRILSEKLSVNEKMIFERTDLLKIGDLSGIAHLLISAFDRIASMNMSQSNLNKEELFLTGMFKSLYSAQISNNITEWFREKCKVFLSANFIFVSPNVENAKNNQAFFDETFQKAIKHFGIHGNEIAYMKSKENNELTPYSLLADEQAIPVDIFESYGTVRFLNIFPLVVQTLQTGSTLIVDEFDASLHPMALMSIVGAFHNDGINKNGAQLIFNTHNPIFLNRNLFRRDEIKFVDRDDETGVSTHYSLSDFGTSGPNAVRNTDDYMRNYFINRYGSISNIDFSDILEERMRMVMDEDK
ncbi:MAG: ATP-binding protein [Eubacteriales bacterium]|nr:ATP-binding protein [Eubacteriales bacterium]